MGQNQGPPREPKATWIRRGRSGCWSCKGRKKKCPGELPSCSSCVRRGIKCDYGFRLTWQDEAESAGIAFGRAGLKNRRGSLKKSAAASEAPSALPNNHYLLPLARCSFGRHWLNTTLTDVSRLCLRVGDARQDIDKGFIAPIPARCKTALQSLPRGLSALPDLQEDESSYFLEYYIRIFSQRRVLTKKAANPYEKVILPLSFHSPGLMDMVIAFASHDMRNQFQGSDCHRYDTVLLRHKLRSIRLVRTQLAASQNTGTGVSCSIMQDKVTRDALLLIITLLGILEIANNSTHEWVLHMKGALSIVRHYRELHGEKAFSREVLEFVSTCFSLRDTFLATTHGDSLYDGEDFHGWLAETGSACPHNTGMPERSRISSYTGISLELLDIISSITSMVRQRRHSFASTTHLGRGDSNKYHGRLFNGTTTPQTQPQPTTLAAQNHSIHVRLLQLQQWSDEPDLNNLVHINAAAFKEAAWIYLRHALCGEPSESMAIQTQHLPRLLSLLDHVHRQSDHPVGSKPYPMWALFVAACVAQEDHRSDVISRFMDLREHRPFSNVPVTMAAVEAVWKKTDLERGVKWDHSSGGGASSAMMKDAGAHSNAGCMLKGEGNEGLVWEGAIHRLGWMMALT